MKKILALLFALLATPAGAQTIPSGAWGSINYWGVGGLSQVLAPGLAGQCLTSQNVGSAPIWVNCQVSSLSLLPPISANSVMANNTLNFVAPQAIDVNRVLDMVGYDIIRPPLPESIIYKSNVGPNFNWQTLPPSTAGSLLTSGGPTNPPFWAPSAAAGNLAAICQTVGAMLYFDTPSLLWKCLNPGTSGQLLQTGGAAGNPSWLMVTLATLGGVPSTRNVNTSLPLGGGGALSSDLTLTCATCVTSSGGGAITGTTPVVVSAAGNVSMANQGTTTTLLHGNAAGNPAFSSIVPADLPLGVPTNTRSAYTSVNSMATTDCGKTVALGGSAFYTFTVNAASTYNAACQVTIANEDSVCPSGGASTCRGKAVAINGYTAFILWPGQQFNLVNQNNVWQYEQPGRWVVQTLPKFYVNHLSGGNPLAATPAVDCLATGAAACNTVQNGIFLIEGMVDCNGFGPTIQLASETFTENNATHTHPIIGYHVIAIQGDTVTPANVTWQVSGSGNAGYVGRDTGMAILTGFTWVSTGSGNVFIQAGQSGIADFGSMVFGANTAGIDIQITPGGAANWFGGTLAITGNMSAFVQMPGDGHVLLDGATIAMSAVTFTNFFQLNGPANVSATSMVFTGAGAGAGSTGRQWLIDRYTNLNVSSSTIPGATNGLYNCQPLVNVFTSGTNTTFTPSTCNGLFPLAIELEIQGGGGGGGASGTAQTAGTVGNPTCWNTSGTACTSPVYQAGGGAGGVIVVGNIAAGGTVSGSGTCDDAIAGTSVGSGSNQGNTPGSNGGSSAFGGGGGSGFSTAGGNAAANSGSGGGGAGVGATVNGGGGGASGALCRVMLTNPAPRTAVYTIGASAAGGTGTFAGGTGAAGRLKVIQRW